MIKQRGGRGKRVPREGMMKGGWLAWLSISLSACLDGSAAGGNSSVIFYGDEVLLGEGVARAYVTMDEKSPIEVGIALSEAALRGLPIDGASGGVLMDDGHSTFEFELPMPEANPTAFQHAVIDWNPAGHEPTGTYDLPHFDFHFYTISSPERHAIDPSDPQFLSKGGLLPPPLQIPAGFVLPDLPPVPFMGAHWLNPHSPELRESDPVKFTHTFIYGSWDGRIIFLEPMITKTVLESRERIRMPIGVAESYQPAGYYPAAYEIRWDEGTREYRVALSDLSWKN